MKLITIVLTVAFLSAAILAAPASALISQNVMSWYWTSDTNAPSAAVGDVNNDGQPEIVTAGYYFDGSTYHALLHVWNSATLAVQNTQTWTWGTSTSVVSVAIGDVNGDGKNEIVTAGTFWDGTRFVAQLHVWNGTTLAPLNVITWFWGSDTQISSIAIGDVNGDGKAEIVTGGAYFDGTRWVAQLHVWNGLTLAVINVQTWFWNSNTIINSVAVGNITGGLGLDIVTAGSYFDGTRNVAQLHVWNGITLAVEKVVTWFWASDTDINSVSIANMTGGNALSIVTGGTYFDGTNNFAQLFVWSTTTPSLTVSNAITWMTTSKTKINSIAVGNYTHGTSLDIVTGGSFNDTTRNNAQLIDFDGSTLAVKSATNWFTTSNTEINSVGIETIGTSTHVVAAGDFFDNIRENAQLTLWG